MNQESKIKSLLDALLRYFEDFNGEVPYFEPTGDGSRYVEAIHGDSHSILTFWELLFCQDINALSIAPRSRNRTLNKDALGALRRNVINDKSQAIIRRNYIPNFSSSRGLTVMEGQKKHLRNVVEMSIQAKYSKKTRDPRRTEDRFVWTKDLKSREEVVVYLYQLIDLLRETFQREPMRILNEKYQWFYQLVQEALDASIEDDSSEERFFAVLAAALVLSLNFVQDEGTNEKIREFLLRYLMPKTQKAPKKKFVSHKKEAARTDEERKLLAKSAIFVNRRFGREMDQDLIDELETIIYALILQLTEEIWTQYTLSQKIQTILEEYQEVMELDEMLSKDLSR